MDVFKCFFLFSKKRLVGSKIKCCSLTLFDPFDLPLNFLIISSAKASNFEFSSMLRFFESRLHHWSELLCTNGCGCYFFNQTFVFKNCQNPVCVSVTDVHVSWNRVYVRNSWLIRLRYIMAWLNVSLELLRTNISFCCSKYLFFNMLFYTVDFTILRIL